MTVRTGAPRRVKSASGTRVVVDLPAGELWFEVDAEHEHLLSHRADHVAVSLIMPAMQAGSNVHVGGVVTDELLHHLNGDFQAVIRLLHPTYGQIEVSADEVAPADSRKAGVATGFSAGVDSFAVLAEHFHDESVPDSLRVTHLLNNNVGSHGMGGEALWKKRLIGVHHVAAEIGLPLVAVNSNLDEHYPWTGFVESHTARNAAVAHLLGGGIGRLLYASAVHYREVHAYPGAGIAYVDPITLPLLSTSSLALTSAGSAQTRVDKTLAIIDTPQVKLLDVCIDFDASREGNCSRCWKCLRTMFTLEVAGRLDDFCPTPFSKGPYLAERAAFRRELLATNDPLVREVAEFAKDRGWTWSAQERALATGLRAKRRGRKALGSFKQRLSRPLRSV